MSANDPQNGTIKKPNLKRVATAQLAAFEDAYLRIPFEICLPQWTPDHYQLVDDIQVFPAGETPAPVGFIATWVNVLNDDEYFQLVALRLPENTPKGNVADAIEERQVNGISARLRERIVMDRDSGRKTKAPGFLISWSRNGVSYQLKDKSGKLDRDELFRIFGSIVWEG